MKKIGSNGYKTFENEEERKWFIENYPRIGTKKLAKMLGVGDTTVRRLASELGLEKDYIGDDLEGEVWKDIEGYEGLYQISSCGRCKSLPKKKVTPSTTYITSTRYIPPMPTRDGYVRFALCKDGKTKRFFAHRLVAAAFIGNIDGLTINHKDENKLNNNVENLETMTLIQNLRYGTGIKRSAQSRTDNPLIVGKAINQYTLEGEFVRRYISINQAKRLNGWTSENIALCCQRKRRYSNGYIWRYDGDTDVVMRNKKTNAVPVLQFKQDGVFVDEYKSLEKATLKTGVCKSGISNCCRGKIKQSGGYVWKYKQDE